MENVVDFVNKFVSKIEPRDDVSGRLEVFHTKEVPNIRSGRNYFNITEICTPSDTFADRKLGKTKSKKLKPILAQGNKIHAIAQNWLKHHRNYCGSEATLDGNFMGIPARGRVDGRIQESIIEIKSINDLPESPEYIIQNYPQYVEQVAFYSIIDPLKPKENYLVFITKESPYKIKSFKLSILDYEKVKNYLKKRIYQLKNVLEDKENPTIFGKCRYCYPFDCNVKEKCQIKELESLKCDIKEFIKLEEDEQFTKDYLSYSSYNILAPRKYCLKKLFDFEENFGKRDSASKAYFGNLIFKFRKTESLFDEKVPSKFKNFELNKYNWFKDKTSIYPEGKRTPFITEVTKRADFDSPGDYKIAELGINLMAHGLTKGMVFSYFPLRDKIKVFEITFDFKGTYLEELKKIIKGLENPEDFKSLPKCSFGCERCVYRKECLN